MNVMPRRPPKSAASHPSLNGAPFGDKSFWPAALAGVAALLLVLPGAAPAHEDLIARIALLTEQLSTNRGRGELFFQRAELFRTHQDWVPALWDYDAAEKLLPHSAAIDLGRAQTLTGLGKWADARSVFDRIIATNPTDAAALLGRARVLSQLHQPELAIADYSRAFTNQTSPRPEDYLERARLQVAQSDPVAALQGLDEGLTRLGWMVTLQLRALEYEQACGNYNGALARLETVIARSKRSESWLQLKGEILQKAGRPAAARAAFQAALKAMDELPPRFARSENMVKLRATIEASLASKGTATQMSP